MSNIIRIPEEMRKEKVEIIIKDGYQFVDEKGNVINATKIVVEKKKKEYPKTYEECCKELNIAVRDLDILDNMLDTIEIIYYKNLDRLLNSFRKLLICRDAYWKIAGDWKEKRNEKSIHYVIYSTLLGEVVKDTIPNCIGNYLLDFPTQEMRDAFFENFKELIESVKELL